ncbi:MAG TPA: tetratricopeptide repeat protein [Hyphomicrobiales bacterium]|nr:tetratricopeptide repeat protein [Kaistiaceae bacterium]HQF29869.1 tetratricopeptide repeat protein [Hyphomicrobiales bacterium]
MALRAVLLAFFLSLIVPIGHGALAEQRVDVEAVAMKEGFGRLVLTFEGRLTLPGYNAEVNNGVLVVKLDEPIAAGVDRVTLSLGEYITVARADPNDKALRFALARAVRVNTMEAGEKLFIDLLPYDWTGLPPGLPEEVVAELARRAQEAADKARAEERAKLLDGKEPKVDVRVGRQPTFTRFAFVWNVPFQPAFARDGGDVAIGFDVFADPDLGPIRSDMPPLVDEITGENGEKGLRIKLKVDPSADVRAFRDGEAYVVDVANPALAAERPDVERQISDAVGSMAGGADARIVTRGRTDGAVAEPDETAPMADVTTTERPLLGGSPAPRPAAAETADMPAEPEAPVAVAEKSKPVEAPAAPASEAAADIAADEVAAAPEPAPREDTADHGSVAPNYVHVETRRIGSTIRLVFPFDNDTPAAVFRRGADLWIVFDSGLPIDLRAVRNDLSDMVVDSQITRSGNSQSIRMTFDQPRLTTMGSEGPSWIVTIGEMVLAPSRPLDIDRSAEPDGRAIVRVPLANAGSVHWIEDPTVGDRIAVVTALGPPRGFIKPLRFVDFEVLPSAHGIAVIPSVDDLKAGIEADIVTISRPKGLTLSNASGRSAAITAPLPEELGRPGFIDFRAWQPASPGDFQNRLSDLQHAAANAEAGNRDQPRLDLARFYLANGLAYEAIGILGMTGAESAAINEDADYRVLLGAADVMAHRPIDAYKALADPALDGNADAQVWRVLAHEQMHNWLEVRRLMPDVETVLASYPLALQTDVNLAAAQASVEINDFASATGYLSEINPATVSNERVARYDLLRARIADASGRTDEALGYYDRVIKTAPRPLAAEAELRKLTQMKRDGVLDPVKGIEALESLSSVWRGDETELKALGMLASLYVDKGRYRDAFTTMRSAMIAAPEDKTTRLIQDEMSTVFADLYLNGKADNMEPLAALALYYDHRQLTPVGRRGDEMVRRLADRLVSVDLLEPAEELLAHQVDNRLKGAARAEVAADLAVIYLTDHKPAEALRTIHRTRQAQLPKTLERRRRIVEAVALGETGRADIALDLLRSFVGADVDRVRADVLWKGEQWQKAAEQIERMYGESWSGDRALDDDQRFDVLRAAIGYALADDRIGLDRLHGKYAAKMAGGAHAHAFDVVTGPIEAQGVEFQSIIAEIGAVDRLQAFLAEYRKGFVEGEIGSSALPAGVGNKG